MDLKEVAIVTMTWARDSGEETLLRESVAYLSALGIPVFITDRGSGEPFRAFLRSLPNVVLLEPAQGVWMQVRSGLLQACQNGSKFIFYTEPDKTLFFASFLSPMLRQITVSERTGVVLASRSAAGFASFPPFQQMTETTINNCCAELIGAPVDYVYGPFLLNTKLVPLLEGLPQQIDWGWRPYAFTVAKRLGYDVAAFTGDFPCPADQQQDNPVERLYRMRQLNQNIEGLLLAVSAQLSDKGQGGTSG